MIYKTAYKNFLPHPDWERTKQIFTKIIDRINDDYELSADLTSFNDHIIFRLTDIEKSIHIRAEKDTVKVSYNPEILKGGIVIESSAEIFHLYWCHQLNLMAAIAAKKIMINGSLQKVMSLGQVVSGCRKLYINFFKEIQNNRKTK